MLSSKYFYVSVLGHGLLLAYFLIIIFLGKNASEPQAVLKAYTKMEANSLIKKTSSITHIQHTQRAITVVKPSTSIVQKDSEKTLLTILYSAISSKQSYPQSALLLHQNGTVKLGFYLYPDGHIDNITILQASGVAALDEAAKKAIQDITPVIEAGNYLHVANYFSVTIRFEQ